VGGSRENQLPGKVVLEVIRLSAGTVEVDPLIRVTAGPRRQSITIYHYFEEGMDPRNSIDGD
jgi:hypothetical protein